MNSTQSRQRQQRRRKLWVAQKNLAEKQVDLTSYERVLADMERRRLSALAEQAISVVVMCRNETKRECARLTDVVAALARKVPP